MPTGTFLRCQRCFVVGRYISDGLQKDSRVADDALTLAAVAGAVVGSSHKVVRAAPFSMGVDAFGVPRFRCKHESGCLCADFCSTLDGMNDADKSDMEAKSRVLTCQRKSELVLNCVCGHPAWDHAGSADDVLCVPDDTEEDEDSTNEWRTLLRGNGGQASLLPLSSLLVESMTMDEAYALLDESRPALLGRLKSVGIERLKDRQDVCNALARRRRLAALEDARAANAASGTGPENWQIKFENGGVTYTAR